MARDPFMRLARTCPHCGSRQPTLGSRCLACDEPFEPQSFIDRMPVIGDEWLLGGSHTTLLLFPVVAVVAVLMVPIAAVCALFAALGRLLGRLIARK